MKKYEATIIFATGYLLMYVLMFQANAPLWLLTFMFTLSPAPVLYMAFQILKNAVYTGKELENGEEFGYQDVDKNQLGLF
jgi:hypothetical protein